MGLGVLNYTKLDHVPGTVLLDDRSINANESQILGSLKRDKGRNAHIVLVPQPSDDPNDPLNWPRWQRDFVMAIILMGALLYASIMTPMISAAQVTIAMDLQVPIAKISQLSGYQVLVVAALGPFVCALARVYGKRPQFLIASVFGIVGTIICETSGKSYNQLLAGRIIEGVAIAAYESVSFTAVGDLYFVHERGVRLSVFNMIFTSVTTFASVIGGPITTNLGWRWMFHIFIIFAVAQLVLLILFGTEPSYNRESLYNTDTTAESNLETLAEVEKAAHATDEKPDLSHIASADLAARRTPRKKTFVQRMAVYNGRFSNENVFKLVLTPFAVCLNPVILWAIVCQGTGVMWYVGFAYVIAQIFVPPPYLLTAAQVGYIYIGPFVLGLLTCILLAIISDPIIKLVTRHNKGVYEPEFRLVLFPFGILFGAIGYFGFGNFYEAGVGGYYLGSVMYALIACALTFQMICVNTYCVDAYRGISTEIFIASMTYKNFFFYGLSLFVNGWVVRSGLAPLSNVSGATTVGVCLFFVPVYVYGKRVRGWWRRVNLLSKFRLIRDQDGH